MEFVSEDPDLNPTVRYWVLDTIFIKDGTEGQHVYREKEGAKD